MTSLQNIGISPSSDEEMSIEKKDERRREREFQMKGERAFPEFQMKGERDFPGFQMKGERAFSGFQMKEEHAFSRFQMKREHLAFEPNTNGRHNRKRTSPRTRSSAAAVARPESLPSVRGRATAACLLSLGRGDLCVVPLERLLRRSLAVGPGLHARASRPGRVRGLRPCRPWPLPRPGPLRSPRALAAATVSPAAAHVRRPRFFADDQDAHCRPWTPASLFSTRRHRGAGRNTAASRRLTAAAWPPRLDVVASSSHFLIVRTTNEISGPSSVRLRG